MTTVYFLTRFSIYRESNAWFMRKYSPEELFSEQRLEDKFFAFEHNALRSINQQTNNNYRWLIYTSDLLPEKWLQKLRELTRSNPRIEIIQVNSMKVFSQKISSYPYGPSYATVRLDDDDGLCPEFVDLVQKYTGSRSVISFPYGKYVDRKYLESGGKEGKFVDKKFPLIGCGITAMNHNIHSLGNHMKISGAILDNHPNVYQIYASPNTDTQRSI